MLTYTSLTQGYRLQLLRLCQIAFPGFLVRDDDAIKRFFQAMVGYMHIPAKLTPLHRSN